MLASLHPICPIFTDQRSCILNAQEPPEIIRMLVPFLKLAVHLGTFQPNLVSLTIFTVLIFYSRLFFLIFCVYISASLFYYLYTKGYYALLVLNKYVYNNSRNSSDSRDIGDSEDKQNVGQQERAQSQRIWWTARTSRVRVCGGQRELAQSQRMRLTGKTRCMQWTARTSTKSAYVVDSENSHK